MSAEGYTVAGDNRRERVKADLRGERVETNNVLLVPPTGAGFRSVPPGDWKTRSTTSHRIARRLVLLAA
jgi:hypothetical protein